MKRASGVLLPVFSLPSKYGIGCFSKEAYKFIDQLKEAGQSYWQILPLGPTGYGDSPYQSFSTYAGNPYFIDLKTLIKEGLLTKKECKAYDFGDKADCIDYEKIYNSRFKMLKKAFARFKNDEAYDHFINENAYWLDDYSLYMAIKDSKNGISWNEWEAPLKNREEDALENARNELAEEIAFYKFQQYEFDKQWTKLHAYANAQGIQIIGDIPIYVAFDGADTWASPELFQFDELNNPLAVAGCPPDDFSATGQLWGNPLYDWAAQKRDGFGWWIRRVEGASRLFDAIRIDHFRAFERYWSIPAGAETAKEGQWEPGPGMDLLRVLTGWFPHITYIAEDLGLLTPEVHQLREAAGLPGMKVLEFAFSGPGNDYLPHNYGSRRCVCYTGTHDNDTALGWYDHAGEAERAFAERYLGASGRENVRQALLRCGMGSTAELFVAQMQDYLALGSEGRINVPGVAAGNWRWRMAPGAAAAGLAADIRRLTEVYGR